MSEYIEKTIEYVKQELSGEGSGHDWWHVYRVWNLAKTICDTEPGANREIVELTALLHDIADYKFHNGDDTVGPRVAKEWLASLGVEADVQDHVADIIMHMSFKGADTSSHMKTVEGKIVQDADRLDAMGAIGIARTFAYGGHTGREMYNPDIKPVRHASFEEYKSNTSPTVNHFYEKLLLLKDRMNTEKGKQLAGQRHVYMEQYLERFYAEWNGNS